MLAIKCNLFITFPGEKSRCWVVWTTSESNWEIVHHESDQLIEWKTEQTKSADKSHNNNFRTQFGLLLNTTILVYTLQQDYIKDRKSFCKQVSLSAFPDERFKWLVIYLSKSIILIGLPRWMVLVQIVPTSYIIPKSQMNHGIHIQTRFLSMQSYVAIKLFSLQI